MSNAEYVQRMRIKFSKFGPTRFISHLDVARTWERALNRAKIPMAYSQGFNRRPRMSFATATPLGTTSDFELIDIWTKEVLDPAKTGKIITEKMAPGIKILDIKEVPITGKKLQVLTKDSTFLVTLNDTEAIDIKGLQQKIDDFLAADEVIRERVVKKKLKQFNLRPMVYDLAIVVAETDNLQLRMRLALEPSNTGRVDQTLLHLGIDPLDAKIHREHVTLIEEPIKN
ncbi:MAG: TIGR03936 family radical SAM-associated protein [Chloroflexota bacterium]